MSSEGVSRSGPVLGPYMYRFSSTTSFTSADLAAPITARSEWRELFGPAVVVGRVEAEVHGVGVGSHVAGEVDVGGVTADRLHAGECRGAAAVDHANTSAVVEECNGDGPAGGAGAEHDVRPGGGHDCTALAGMNEPMIMLCRKVELIAP